MGYWVRLQDLFGDAHAEDAAAAAPMQVGSVSGATHGITGTGNVSVAPVPLGGDGAGPDSGSTVDNPGNMKHRRWLARWWSVKRRKEIEASQQKEKAGWTTRHR
jgi:hypothetical protein